MFLNFKKILENIRQKDEPTRKIIMWVFVFFSMIIFIFIWLFSMRTELNKLKVKTASESQFSAQVKEVMPLFTEESNNTESNNIEEIPVFEKPTLPISE